MQYAILCYHDENVVCAWSKQQDDAVMAKLAVVQERLARQGKLGPVVRLLPTTAATTLRKDREQQLVIAAVGIASHAAIVGRRARSGIAHMGRSNEVGRVR